MPTDAKFVMIICLAFLFTVSIVLMAQEKKRKAWKSRVRTLYANIPEYQRERMSGVIKPLKRMGRNEKANFFKSILSNYQNLLLTSNTIDNFITSYDYLVCAQEMLAEQGNIRLDNLPKDLIKSIYDIDLPLCVTEFIKRKVNVDRIRRKSNDISQMLKEFTNTGAANYARFSDNVSSFKNGLFELDEIENHYRMSSILDDANRAQIKNIREGLEGFLEIAREAEEVMFSDTADIDSMSGTEFEAWCAALLLKNGFSKADVTKASGDHGVDIVAEKDGIYYAIQCKCYHADLGNTPVQEVYAGKEMYKCQVGVVMTNRHFTKGAKELAESTRVLLWDRDKLVSMMQ